MRIYVAGAYADRVRVVRCYNLVQEAGFDLAHDWVSVMDAVGVPDHEVSAQDRRAHAEADLRQLGLSDVFWFLVPPPGMGAGSWVEFGVAVERRMHLDKPRIVASGIHTARSVFTELADALFVDDIEAFDWINKVGP